jgi:DNA replication protein DnaC
VAAEKAWQKITPDAILIERILLALAVQATSPQWVRDGGTFIPHAGTWLNGRQWEDEVVPAEPRRLESKRTEGNLAVLREFVEAGR